MGVKGKLSTFGLLDKIRSHASASPSSIAITDLAHGGLAVTYSQLLSDTISLAATLVDTYGSTGQADDGGLKEDRICILCSKGYLVPLAMLAVWTAGGLAVPLLPGMPLPEHEYMVENSEAKLIICDEKMRPRAEELAVIVKKNGGRQCEIMELDLEDIREKSIESGNGEDALEGAQALEGHRRAMMLFTSGTTGRPKGVVTRHSALSSQVSALVEAWRWTPSDNLLHILPLNHLHGITVALLPTLWAGASVELWEKFDGPAIWRRWINKEAKEPITMFFGVPTVYSRLIAAHAALSPEEQKEASEGSSRLRLQVSGSAPLPESVKKTWEEEGGVGGGMKLLERYGMTETGIIAGTGWEDAKRVKGHVGWPLSNVKLRLWDKEADKEVKEEDVPGEVEVSGPGIFIEYWHLPEVTAKEFHDGWFKTGDVAVYSSEPAAKGQVKILGRNSTDIIKSGGEKLSAIEIERVILELEGMQDVAVVGIEDEEWGQVVGACIVTTRPDLTIETLRSELRAHLTAYKIPKRLKLYEGEIPRNTMGKVNKKQLVLDAFPKQSA
ncbi:putative long-chain acyl-CoA synthetase [Kockovaella imperatae]|uniref:Putative long-chain acyl-CoA synthetase n=1 Tax=Kockovaella imperatae TaxID=4999 RepID=A0A1Y1UDA2_9TREE|nr:putative long-chain acyl-CoA synthetase [Kockovaella imperatae]ORX35959.1 putative long-chain acyl-CoA synthetase [Kockovaella imperatae]